jgi:F-type H+-transporting ATPase subunit delta
MIKPAALAGRGNDKTVGKCGFRGIGSGFPLSFRDIEGSSDVASEAGVSGLAERYAKALFELADEQKALDAVADDVRTLGRMIAESADFRRLIRSPVLSRLEQGKAVAAVAERAGFSALTRNLVGVMAHNRRLFVLPEVIQGYLRELAERRGEVTAQVTAARALTPQQAERVNEQLRRAVGRKVSVDIRVDPSLIGGMIVRVGSRMIDASLKSKLARLRLAMKGV